MCQENTFIKPDGSNKTAVLKIFNEVTNLLVDFISSADQKPVLPSDEQLNKFNFEIPIAPLNKEKLQEELVNVINMSMNPANRGYIGHMDSLPSTYSIIGSLYSAALNNNMFSLEMSPYFTRLEYALLKQFSDLFGLPSSATGIIVSGGTLSNIQAVITARNYFLKSNDGDLSRSKGKLVLFANEHAHVSIKKACMIAGLGIDSLVLVYADANGKMNTQDLIFKINNTIQNGQSPFAVVATIGATVTGSIDPIEEIAEICKQYNLWLHTDAIYGGAIILSQTEKHRLNGIEKSDSISFNPQKWMHIAKTCSMLMFRDQDILQKYFSMKAFYTKEQDQYINLSELSIQGTKHAEVLKLWLSILSIGLSGYEKMIDRSYAITKQFVSVIKQIPEVEFASVPEMNIPTFRLRASEETRSNQLNKEFNEYAIREHNLFFSLPTHNNKLWQRTILLNPFIDDETINKVEKVIKLFIYKTQRFSNENDFKV
ncbi:MAG: aminotransferase class V-fold PLP-dependent enzyme [Saprospiraceae bacterium]|nr:aminotransferase class V-fold PLP-dependent enzyme [Saprospiraceae bacterium]